MSKNITLIIDNIITPYEIVRYNEINRVLNGTLEVWFQAKSDKNRHWKKYPEIEFKYKVLEDTPLRFTGKDVHTFHINLRIHYELEYIQSSLSEVIICGWDSLTYWYTAWFCTRKNITYRLWSGSTEYEKSWRRTLFSPVIKWLISRASGYIAYGTRARHFLMMQGASQSKIKVFTNSVDVDFFCSEAIKATKERLAIRGKLGYSPSDFVVLYVGQLIERKGILDLIAAIESRAPEYKLLIVGTGPLSKKIETEHDTSKIKYIGHIEYTQLPEIYVTCDALVLPSYEEVWGLVINEALACGTPVLTSSMTGASEDLVVPGKTGYTYNPEEKDALQEGLEKIKNTSFSKRILTSAAKATHPALFARSVFGDI